MNWIHHAEIGLVLLLLYIISREFGEFTKHLKKQADLIRTKQDATYELLRDFDQYHPFYEHVVEEDRNDG